MMEDVKLYLAIGLPCLTIMTTLVISLVQWTGVRDSIKEIRDDIKEIRSDLKLPTGKVYEIMEHQK